MEKKFVASVLGKLNEKTFRMNFDQIIPIIYMIGVLILVLPSFLHSNSKLKQLLANLSIWVIIVLIVTTISYFLFK